MKERRKGGQFSFVLLGKVAIKNYGEEERETVVILKI